MQNSTAVSPVRPGRAVSQADAKAPTQLLRQVIPEMAAARSRDVCLDASASSIANTTAERATVSACVTAH